MDTEGLCGCKCGNPIGGLIGSPDHVEMFTVKQTPIPAGGGRQYIPGSGYMPTAGDMRAIMKASRLEETTKPAVNPTWYEDVDWNAYTTRNNLVRKRKWSKASVDYRSARCLLPEPTDTTPGPNNTGIPLYSIEVIEGIEASDAFAQDQRIEADLKAAKRSGKRKRQDSSRML